MDNDKKTIGWIQDIYTNYISVCRRCGATTPNNTKFKCSNCNRRVEQKEYYCPSCGGKWERAKDMDYN